MKLLEGAALVAALFRITAERGAHKGRHYSTNQLAST